MLRVLILVASLVPAAASAVEEADMAAALEAARQALTGVDAEVQQEQLEEARRHVESALRAESPQLDLDTPADALGDAFQVPDKPRAWDESGSTSFVALVSFAMPQETLISIARDAARLGAPLVLRGLVDDSLEATADQLQAFSDIDVGFAVDPTLYRRFAVEAVPTYLLFLEPLETCTDHGCQIPAHLRLAGEASLEHVLQTMRRAGPPEARQLAGELLNRLEISR